MIKEGTILESGNGQYTYEVVKHRILEKYNLLNVKTNQLEFIIFDTLEGLEEKVEAGIFKYKVYKDASELGAVGFKTVGDALHEYARKKGKDPEAMDTQIDFLNTLWEDKK